MAATLLFSSFFLLLCIGMPIFAALGLAGIVAILTAGLSMDAVAISVQTTISKYNLLAVPMFVLTGAVLEVGRREALVDARRGDRRTRARLARRHRRGPRHSDGRYFRFGCRHCRNHRRCELRRRCSAPAIQSRSLQPSSGRLALDHLVPPSVTLIVYSIMVPEARVPDMFAAGLVPGRYAVSP